MRKKTGKGRGSHAQPVSICRDRKGGRERKRRMKTKVDWSLLLMWQRGICFQRPFFSNLYRSWVCGEDTVIFTNVVVSVGCSVKYGCLKMQGNEGWGEWSLSKLNRVVFYSQNPRKITRFQRWDAPTNHVNQKAQRGPLSPLLSSLINACYVYSMNPML